MFAMTFGSLNEIEKYRKCHAPLDIFVFNVKRKYAFTDYLSIAY